MSCLFLLRGKSGTRGFGNYGIGCFGWHTNENENYVRKIKHIGLISVAIISFFFQIEFGTHGVKEWHSESFVEVWSILTKIYHLKGSLNQTKGMSDIFICKIVMYKF